MCPVLLSVTAAHLTGRVLMAEECAPTSRVHSSSEERPSDGRRGDTNSRPSPCFCAKPLLTVTMPPNPSLKQAICRAVTLLFQDQGCTLTESWGRREKAHKLAPHGYRRLWVGDALQFPKVPFPSRRP
eukprot:superscaffoldBa00001138_g9140